MTKKLLFAAMMLFAIFTTKAQSNVGVGTANPDASAKLDVTSTTQGMLIPRMTEAQRILINTPATGLLVYQTNAPAGFYFFDGTVWTLLGSKGDIGPQGPKGDTGTNGVDGLKGDKGDKGDTGANGVDGLKGDKGDAGTNGMDGLKGDKGDKGDAGANGLDGLKGDKGDKGDAGANGLDGLKGDKGDTGTNGVDGLKGDKGDTGATGTNGQGVPIGGTANQILTKVDGTDYNTAWTTPAAGTPSQLEKITEGANTGYRILGRDPANYGNIGSNAVDLSVSNAASTTKGATGKYSVAMGESNIASGYVATAMGTYTIASDAFSTAMGSYTTASGGISTAMGDNTSASGATSTAMGYVTTASGIRSTAMGSSTTASGFAATAMGNSTAASGNYATAMGASTTASGFTSTAIGISTTAPSYGETAMGSFNTTYTMGTDGATTTNATDRLLSVGNGISSTTRSNALTILKNGNTGIGFDAPAEKLEINGKIKIVDGNQAAGKVLTTDANGVGTWQAASGGGTHYLGEAFDGGIIYYLYKGSDGLEHGLIVALTESTGAWQTTNILVNANRTEGGVYNTNLMIINGSSPAATYITGLGAGWYLPSIDELGLLYYNRYSAQKGLRAGGNTLLSTTAYYWSSTESNATSAYNFIFNNGYAFSSGKPNTNTVRGVRAF
jgi:hypothetical protein